MRQLHHPLHPQHTLAIHFRFPYVKSFVCSFCEKPKQSRRFYQCSEEQCHFHLDDSCKADFGEKPELLDKYEIQHVFHNHENHRLSPYSNSFLLYYGSYTARCSGCGDFIGQTEPVYKCTGCDFYLHTECSQVPKDVQHHYSHPHHPLVLLHNPPAPAASDDHQSKQQQQQLRCIACLKWMEDEFYLHCTHCPTFNLDLQCYFRFLTTPTVKHEAHEHPLAYFSQIYDDDVRCYACNTSCKDHLFRCFTCNFNIHSDCLALPITANYDDHVHPLTFTAPFKEYSYSKTYYCDICEKTRDPDHGIYLCKECPFIAHFGMCSFSEKDPCADEPWRQKQSDEDQEDLTLPDEKVSLEILDQLNEEIERVRGVIEQLIIKKQEGEQLTEKLQEFQERHANTEEMLRRLKQSVTGTNSN